MNNSISDDSPYDYSINKEFLYIFESNDIPEEIIEDNYMNEINKNEESSKDIVLHGSKEIKSENIILCSSVKTKKVFFYLNKEKDNTNINDSKKKLGRKRKNSFEYGYHNKFSGDNMIRKIKFSLIKTLLNYINKKIKKIYNGNIGYDNNKKVLLQPNLRNIIGCKISINKKLLLYTIKDIFYNDISNKYIRYSRDHNKKIIDSLLNEIDEKKKKFFQKLFNLTFNDCLKYFSGEKNIKELSEMIKSNEAFAHYKNQDSDYYDNLTTYVKNFETIIQNKKQRNRKKN